MEALETRLKRQAHALGLDLVGVAPAGPADGFARLGDWLARGYAGDMEYMHRHGDARREPSSILPEVRSVVMVGLNYKPRESEDDSTPPLRGRVARYARGPDYHTVLRERLTQLLHWLQGERPGSRGRAVVDTAPLLERDFARRAGLGWFGKNTMLLNKRLGGYFFLGALLTDVELTADEPFAPNHCGTCTACLDACPTQAFVGPGWLDSRKCISYLTIELHGPVEPELRHDVGDWLFGCDVCQEVCPWNRKAPATTDAAFGDADLATLDLVEILVMTEEDFRRRFRGTALMRTRRRGLLRNAAIVLGNAGDARALPALRRAAEDSDEVVREAAEWAIGEIERRIAMRDQRTSEPPGLSRRPRRTDRRA
jgi:epoxyqueuosine reductase